MVVSVGGFEGEVSSREGETTLWRSVRWMQVEVKVGAGESNRWREGLRELRKLN